ncbi:uncharacterized protein ACIBXB_011011 [Morphnus guianensis]
MSSHFLGSRASVRVVVALEDKNAPPAAQGDGDGVYGQFITRYFLPLHPPQGEDSSHSSHPRETVLHELLQRGSFPRAAVLHELLQHGSFPRCAVLQAQTAPAWVPHGVTSPARKPAPLAPLSTDPQVLPGACSSAGFPRGHSLLREPTCSGVGSSTGCRWISAPLWTSMDCRGTACLTMVFTTGCRGISAPAPGASPPPPSSLTLVSAGLFLLHVLTPLSGCRIPLSQLFFLLKNVIPEALPLSLIGSALASSGSVSEPAGMGSLKHRGSFQQLLTEAAPVTPAPLPKPCHTKPIQGKSHTHTKKY